MPDRWAKVLLLDSFCVEVMFLNIVVNIVGDKKAHVFPVVDVLSDLC